ncbi:MAG: sulfotransferase [Cyanobacteria bacterium J06636_16]
MPSIARAVKQKVKKLDKQLKTEWYVDYGSNYRNSVFLAGVSRSGTTWLSDVLNYKNQYRYLFEPFFPAEVELCRNLRARQYIPEDSTDKAFTEIACRVITGNVKSHWADRFNTKPITNKRLIKAIRANLFLKWLYNTFPELPVIFLIRHPLAVAVSKVKLNWQRTSIKYLTQPKLMEDFLQPFQAEIEQAEERYQASGNSFENHIISWCIENYVPLKQFQSHEMHVVFYENCCTQPEIETRRLFSYLGEGYDESILKKVRSASKLSRDDSAIMTGTSLVDSWKKHVTIAQVERALEILSLFGLDKLYAYESMPYSENLHLVMKGR